MKRWPRLVHLPSERNWPAYLRLLLGNVPAQGGHLTCFAGDRCESSTAKLADWQNMAGVDLGGFWWYQKQAGLAGVFLNSGGLHAPI